MGKMKTAYNIPVGKQLEKTISDMQAQEDIIKNYLKYAVSVDYIQLQATLDF